MEANSTPNNKTVETTANTTDQHKLFHFCCIKCQCASSSRNLGGPNYRQVIFVLRTVELVSVSLPCQTLLCVCSHTSWLWLVLSSSSKGLCLLFCGFGMPRSNRLISSFRLLIIYSIWEERYWSPLIGRGGIGTSTAMKHPAEGSAVTWLASGVNYLQWFK